MNGEANCILEVCCPPDETGAATQNARDALATHMMHDCALSTYDAQKVADYIFKHFDLAERGTLRALKASVVRVSKQV